MKKGVNRILHFTTSVKRLENVKTRESGRE